MSCASAQESRFTIQYSIPLFQFSFFFSGFAFPLLTASSDFSPFTSHIPGARMSKNFVYARSRSAERTRSRGEEKKSVDACDEGEAANTCIFIYANRIRSRLIVRPHTRDDSRNGSPGVHPTCQSRDKGTRDALHRSPIHP